MKRPIYQLQLDGHPVAARAYSWNAALRGADRIVRDTLAPGEEARRVSCERVPLDDDEDITASAAITYDTPTGTATVRVKLLNPEDFQP